MKRLLYGGDYYPEQWLDSPEILKKDIEHLKKAHMNVVSLGVFAWSMMEPEEGVYHFEWLEDIINELYQNGISVMLATPSGAKPRWLAKKYPEILRVDENRVRNLYGERHNHCYTSLEYRRAVRNINGRLAERFAGNPAVVAWHISNEYGGECHCPLCQKEFRHWLQKKYKTIDRLNKAWWSIFWNHTYTDFEEVESPSPIGEKSIHGLNLDWKRFVSDQTIDFMKYEIQALRDYGASQPVTTNMMYDFKGINYGKMAEFVDVVSWDTYPLWGKEENERIAMDCGMQHDYMRSLKNKPFLLMESCPTATNWQGVSKLKRPGVLLNASLQTIAHGGDSVQYFQIRQSRGSFEKFHGAVIDHYGGEDARVFKEVTEVGSALKQLQIVTGTQVQSDAAVLYDVENRWALEDAQGPRNKGLHYHETAWKSYRALKDYGINVDVIDMDRSLDGYKVIVAPMLYLFRSDITAKIRRFVKEGGILIMTCWSGVVNDTDLCFLGETPHDLTDVLGLRREEIDGLYDWEENEAVPIKGNEMNIAHSYQCRNLCELVQIKDAVTLMAYGKDFYEGKPVLTRNVFGKGQAYYICADMEESFYVDVYHKILRQKNIPSILPEVPQGVEVSSRRDQKNEYIFIHNFTGEKITMKLPDNVELLFGMQSEFLEPMTVKVVKRKI